MIGLAKPTTYRSKAHLAFVRSRPCCWCFPGKQRSETQASHHGPHGMAIKSDDTTAIPLCLLCHERWGHGTLPGSSMNREQLDAWATEQALKVCTARIAELEARRKR